MITTYSPAYIKNYTVINILGDVKGKIKELREKLQELIGLEIMEVSQDKIIAKSFLDLTQSKVDNSMKRIYYLIKNMADYFRKILKDFTENVLSLPDCLSCEEIFTYR